MLFVQQLNRKYAKTIYLSSYPWLEELGEPREPGCTLSWRRRRRPRPWPGWSPRSQPRLLPCPHPRSSVQASAMRVRRHRGEYQMLLLVTTFFLKSSIRSSNSLKLDDCAASRGIPERSPMRKWNMY